MVPVTPVLGFFEYTLAECNLSYCPILRFVDPQAQAQTQAKPSVHFHMPPGKYACVMECPNVYMECPNVFMECRNVFTECVLLLDRCLDSHIWPNTNLHLTAFELLSQSMIISEINLVVPLVDQYGLVGVRHIRFVHIHAGLELHRAQLGALQQI
jgi:hypothetical protein